MKNKKSISKRLLLSAVAALSVTAGSLYASPSVFPTGTTVYDPAKAYNSYVIFSALDGNTHLIDLDGNEVHSWPHVAFPAGLLDPALTKGELGHVIVQLQNGPGIETGFFNNKVLGELDWDGKTVWQWGAEAPGGEAKQHHDWGRLANGDTLVLSHLTHVVQGLSGKEVLDDVIYEVTTEGKTVWTWVAGDHLDEYGFTPTDLKYLKGVVERGKNVDWLHINDMKVVGPNHWFDEGDKRFDPNNIIVDSRNANFIVIIDKTSGKIVWGLGPDYPRLKIAPGLAVQSAKPALPRPVDQISGQHDAQIIPVGLKGAGDLLVFDNQGSAGYPPVTTGAGSRVLEIDPIKKQVVWEYTAEYSGRPAWTFRSHFISDARRLPNGNTFIDEGMNGRFFQVTPNGDIVWEYISPYVSKEDESAKALNGRAVISNDVYRAIPVPYEWVPAGTPHSEKAVGTGSSTAAE